MPKHETWLIDRRPAAKGTLALAFERPPGFDYRAGQALTLVLPDPPYTDAKGNRRTFSIASPPQEAERLEIASRMTPSAMKRSLAEVPVRTPFQIVGPFGTFSLHEDAGVPAVMIAGGIGITPLRSIARDAVARGLQHRILLVYSNRTLDDAAFHEEFVSLGLKSPRFTYVPTMTQAERTERAWAGERRRVDAAFLRDHAVDLTRSIFYVVGSPMMVDGVTGALIEAGVDPERIRTEEFAGYARGS